MNKKVLIVFVIIIAVLIVFAVISPSEKEEEQGNVSTNTNVETNQEVDTGPNTETETDTDTESETDTDNGEEEKDKETEKPDQEIKDFSAPDFPENSVLVTELTPVKGEQDYTSLKVNKSVWGRDLVVSHVKYEKGLGTHANSEYSYNIDGKYTT